MKEEHKYMIVAGIALIAVIIVFVFYYPFGADCVPRKVDVIMFAGEECYPCALQTDVFEEIQRDYPRFTYQIIDMQDCSAIAAKHNVYLPPTLKFGENKTMVGFVSMEKMLELLEEHVGFER